MENLEIIEINNVKEMEKQKIETILGELTIGTIYCNCDGNSKQVMLYNVKSDLSKTIIQLNEVEATEIIDKINLLSMYKVFILKTSA
jgi:hypothetical protein